MKVSRSPSDRVFRTIGFVFMFIVSAIFVFAVLWMFLNSLRSAPDYRLDSFKIIDFKRMSFKNYKELFTMKVDTSVKSVGMLEMVGNTLIVTAGCIVCAVTIPAITGYVVAKYNFLVKRIMDVFAIVTMIIPTVGSTIPLYRLIYEMHLMDTYFAIFIQYASGFGFTYLIFRSFYSSIPIDYMEAAFLDGASNARVFLNVMLPQSFPIMLSVAIMQFVGVWNDYYTPYMFMEGNPTVAVGVNMIYQKYAATKNNYPVAFTAMSFSTIVSLLLYACFSKTIMQSMSVGGLKG